MIYPQTVRQPDQNSDFYTTGLVPANQLRKGQGWLLLMPIDMIQRRTGLRPLLA